MCIKFLVATTCYYGRLGLFFMGSSFLLWPPRLAIYGEAGRPLYFPPVYFVFPGWGDLPPVEDEVDRLHPIRLSDLGVWPKWFLDGLDLSEARPEPSDRFPACRQQTGNGCRTRFPVCRRCFLDGGDCPRSAKSVHTLGTIKDRTSGPLPPRRETSRLA